MKKTILLTSIFVAMLFACKKDDIDPNQFLFNEDAMYGNSDAADKTYPLRYFYLRKVHLPEYEPKWLFVMATLAVLSLQTKHECLAVSRPPFLKNEYF